MMREREFHAPSGLGMLVILLLVIAGSLVFAGQNIRLNAIVPAVLAILLAVVAFISSSAASSSTRTRAACCRCSATIARHRQKAGLRWATRSTAATHLSFECATSETEAQGA